MNPTDPASVVGRSPDVSPALARLILHRMNANAGWLPFEQFMALALYAPGLGYYSSGRTVIGLGPADGSDFVTAPTLSPLFGEMLAKQVLQALQATQTREVWEFGAGRGTLAAHMLPTLGPHIDAYRIVELSGSLRQVQAQTVAQVVTHAHKVQWVDQWPDRLAGVVVGNEVLDAMPVQLLTWDGGQWLERGVRAVANAQAVSWQWEDRVVNPGLRPPTDHPDAAFSPGTVVEVHRQAEAFVRSLAERMQQGAVFLVDYGFGESEFYLPQRSGGTLMCHHHHRSDPDPLVHVGEKDITAHVNFTGIALAGQDSGLEVLGYTTQARFLMNLGVLSALPDAQAENLTPAQIQPLAAAQKLLGEHEMGELFKVIGFVKGPWFDAIGFVEGDRTHCL